MLRLQDGPSGGRAGVGGVIDRMVLCREGAAMAAGVPPPPASWYHLQIHSYQLHLLHNGGKTSGPSQQPA